MEYTYFSSCCLREHVCFSFVVLHVVYLTDVENISGCLEGTMRGCGLTTKPLAALRSVGNSWIVEV